MRYLLRTNTSYEHLAKKFEQAVLTCVGRDGSEMAVSLRRFFARYRFLASANGLYELASTFCHVAPDSESAAQIPSGTDSEHLATNRSYFFVMQCYLFMSTLKYAFFSKLKPRIF